MSNVNDQVMRFPLAVPPDTWALNDTYLDLLDYYTKIWRDKGYEWKFGTEIDFDIKNVALYAKRKDKDEVETDRQYSERYVPRDRNDWNALAQLATPARIKKQREAMGAEMLRQIDQGIIPDEYFQSVGLSRAEVREEVAAYIDALKNGSPRARVFNKQFLLLSHLHLLTTAQGGLRDIIESRFGNNTIAVGWYDFNINACEVRLKPQDDHRQFIANYHNLLDNLYHTPIRYGMTAEPDLHHLHFSVNEIATGINVMESQEPRHIALKRLMMWGLGHMMCTYPPLFSDHNPDSMTRWFNFSSNSHRDAELRQKGPTWEYRGDPSGHDKKKTHPFGTQILHMARMMSTFMMAAHAGFEPEHVNSAGGFTPDQINTVWKPQVTSQSVLAAHALKSTLEHCIIGDDGWLIPDAAAVANNMSMMLDEVAVTDGGTIQNKSGETIRLDLAPANKKIKGWMDLFSAMRVDDGNTLILPDGLDPELASAFKALRIHGRRAIFLTSVGSSNHGFGVFLNVSRDLKRLQRKMSGSKAKIFGNLQKFYDDYPTVQAKRMSAYFNAAVANLAKRSDYDSETGSNLAIVMYLLGDIEDLHFQIRSQQARNKSGVVRMRRSTFLNGKMTISALQPVFDDAVDYEIAYRHKRHEASNQMIAALEDIRRDVGHFEANPQGLLGVYMGHAVHPSGQQHGQAYNFYHDMVMLTFCSLLSSPQTTPQNVRAQAESSRTWLENACKIYEQKNPDASAEYMTHKAQLVRAHEMAIRSVQKITSALERGRRASVKLIAKF